MQNNNQSDLWYKLDNAAKIYPPTEARYNSNVFRISVTLDKPIDKDFLQKAASNIISRFPYYKVRLRKGLFWYYLENNKKEIFVHEDIKYPCGYMNRDRNNSYLIKIFYYKNRIAVEFFHALTDGTGGLIFLKSLLGEYFRILEIDFSPDADIFVPSDLPDDEEAIDAFKMFYNSEIPRQETDSRAFNYKDKMISSDDSLVISGQIPLVDIKKACKKYNVTITEFLVATYLDVLQTIQEETVKNRKKFKPIRISVPVNMRKIYGSKTMRNFALFVLIGIDTRLGHYEFEEILEQVHYTMKLEINTKSLSRQISRNVAGERNVFIRIAPLIFKKPFMKILSSIYGDNSYSATLSNLGAVKFPKEIEKHIERMDFILPPNITNRTAGAVVSIGEYIYINFSRFLIKPNVEELFFTSLVKEGIHVKISGNE